MSTAWDGKTATASGRVARWLCSVDARMLALPKPVRYTVLSLTIAAMIWQALPWVPRPIADYSHIPLLRGLRQPASYGSDTLSDEYEARVILHDPKDMYVKRETAQTPLEARTWSKAAVAPYPPAALFIEAALFAIGGRTLSGFYRMILVVAVIFFALSLLYFLRTRWYVFPLLYLNFAYVASRFVGVQDDTYLIMLVVIMCALLVAERQQTIAHELMALAVVVKFSPLYYAIETLRMRRGAAIAFTVILLAGLVAPVVFLHDYLSIYTFEATLKGSRSMHISAVAAATPFALALWYVETRRSFDLEERIGWSLVPFALFFALSTNAARHLLLALLVPDKRAWRNLAAATALALHAAFPDVIRLGSVLSIATGLLVVILGGHLYAIGWDSIRDDFRHPLRTVCLMAGRSA